MRAQRGNQPPVLTVRTPDARAFRAPSPWDAWPWTGRLTMGLALHLPQGLPLTLGPAGGHRAFQALVACWDMAAETPHGQRRVLSCRRSPRWGPGWGAGAPGPAACRGPRISLGLSCTGVTGTEQHSDLGEHPEGHFQRGCRWLGVPRVAGGRAGRSPMGVCLGPGASGSSPGSE